MFTIEFNEHICHAYRWYMNHETVLEKLLWGPFESL